MRVRWRNVLGGSLVALLLCGAGSIAFLHLTSGGRGSADEARRIAAVLSSIGRPETVVGVDPEYAAKRFDDGEWLLGIARSSHGVLSKFRGGGTMFVKDSRGRTTSYCGHVCGPFARTLRHVRSLDEFYEEQRRNGMVGDCANR